MNGWSVLSARRYVEPWFLTLMLMAFTTTGIVPILLPLEVIKIEGSALHVGVILAAIGAGMLTAPLWGEIAGRFHNYRLLGAGGAFAVGGALVGFSNAHNVGTWFWLAFLVGCGVASSFTVANLLIVCYHPMDETEARIGWLQTCVTIGTVLGLAVAGYVSHMHTHEGFLMGACTACVAGLIALATMRVPCEASHPSVVCEIEKRAQISTPHAAWWHLCWRSIFTDGLPMFYREGIRCMRTPLVLFLVLWLVANVGMMGLNALYPLVMQQAFGVYPAVASYILSAATALSTVMYLRAGQLTKVSGGRYVMMRALVIRGVSLALMAALTLFTFDRRGAAALALFCAATLVWPLLCVSSTVVVARLAVDKGGDLGLYNAATAVAGMVGPVIAGHLADRLGYGSVVVFALAFVLLGLAMTTLLPPSTKSSEPAADAAQTEGLGSPVEIAIHRRRRALGSSVRSPRL